MFLRDALPLVQEEPETVAWFAIRMGKSTFGIVDAFPTDAGRQAHLSGKVAAALMAKASELFATPPAIEKVDVLAANSIVPLGRAVFLMTPGTSCLAWSLDI